MSLEAFARLVVMEYLNDGIPFCDVYENDEIVGADLDDDDLITIHELAEHKLYKIAEAL